MGAAFLLSAVQLFFPAVLLLLVLLLLLSAILLLVHLENPPCVDVGFAPPR